MLNYKRIAQVVFGVKVEYNVIELPADVVSTIIEGEVAYTRAPPMEIVVPQYKANGKVWTLNGLVTVSDCYFDRMQGFLDTAVLGISIIAANCEYGGEWELPVADADLKEELRQALTGLLDKDRVEDVVNHASFYLRVQPEW